MKPDRDDIYKVGISNDPVERRRKLQVGFPDGECSVHLLYAERVPDAKAAESILKCMMADYKEANGQEWFRVYAFVRDQGRRIMNSDTSFPVETTALSWLWKALDRQFGTVVPHMHEHFVGHPEPLYSGWAAPPNGSRVLMMHQDNVCPGRMVPSMAIDPHGFRWEWDFSWGNWKPTGWSHTGALRDMRNLARVKANDWQEC
jgi:hypothetical protein